jgi:hypothetical protein
MSDTATNTPEPAKEETKTKKTPAPEGFVTAVDFAKEVDKHKGNAPGTTRPQFIYGYIRNSKTFQEVTQDRGEGVSPRFCVKLKEGLAWIDGQAQRKTEREAAKAAKDAAAAQAAQASAAKPAEPKPAEPAKAGAAKPGNAA